MKYATIVADPPWDHSDGTGYSYGEKHREGTRNGSPRSTTPPYPTLTAKEIANLVLPAADDAHVYLWTTQRYLRASFEVLDAWGFRVSSTLVWCKAPKGFMGGAYRSSTEFCQFARRGSLAHLSQAPAQWFTWPRSGYTQHDPAAAHSAKPPAFYDLVESVSPGPYLDLFARRQRLGWDTWGNEALEHVSMGLPVVSNQERNPE